MTPEQAAALQQLDEALTAAGHDSECAAYEPGKECSCGVGNPALDVPANKWITPGFSASAAKQRAREADDHYLTGEQAVTYRRMLEAGRRARDAQQAVAAANQEFQQALAAHLEVAAR